MKCRLAWSAQQEIEVVPNNYFESVILMDNKTYPDTAGCDIFLLAGVILPGKRLAGFGRNKCYQLADMSAIAMNSINLFIYRVLIIF